ncbi:unnamed protein product [Periconia digitata]|uniref:Uncharacterized protein n=1 Tax=Periconia digitata TaxID=1303443 RepID=A0A9W4UBF8_9PLEO|nr:unnamed protein product [Periconia digitata]
MPLPPVHHHLQTKKTTHIDILHYKNQPQPNNCVTILNKKPKSSHDTINSENPERWVSLTIKGHVSPTTSGCHAHYPTTLREPVQSDRKEPTPFFWLRIPRKVFSQRIGTPCTHVIVVRRSANSEHLHIHA